MLLEASSQNNTGSETRAIYRYVRRPRRISFTVTCNVAWKHTTAVSHISH